jgi:hypothetical protein
METTIQPVTGDQATFQSTGRSLTTGGSAAQIRGGYHGPPPTIVTGNCYLLLLLCDFFEIRKDNFHFVIGRKFQIIHQPR